VSNPLDVNENDEHAPWLFTRPSCFSSGEFGLTLWDPSRNCIRPDTGLQIKSVLTPSCVECCTLTHKIRQYYHLPLHRATTTTVHMTAPVPEVIAKSSCIWQSLHSQVKAVRTLNLTHHISECESGAAMPTSKSTVSRDKPKPQPARPERGVQATLKR
jgi:hypothetical protein